jgi:myo-inositol 2-dehydrogenase/D-chiro-inositol 1-dehydrogenase
MLGVGLLGAGRIGNVHAKAISTHPQSKLVAVSDVNAEAAAKLAGLYGAEVCAATRPSLTIRRSAPF